MKSFKIMLSASLVAMTTIGAAQADNLHYIVVLKKIGAN